MSVFENLDNYKLSRFVRLYKKPDCYFVYNSQNGVKAKIYDTELLQQIETLSSGETLSEIDQRLIKTEICVKEYIDEEAVILNKIKSTLTANFHTLRLIILPTRDCNFNCVYCYEEKRKEVMSEETISGLIEATKNYMENYKTVETLQLEWFGGEPLLCYDIIIKISSALHEYCIENKKHFWMSMTTNGYLLTLEKAKELLKYNCVSYQVTIDGSSEYHDKLRVLRNGGPTWDMIYSNMLALKEIDEPSLKIRLRINYHANMLIDIEEFLKKIKTEFNDSRFNVYMIKINPPRERNADLDYVSNRAELLAQDFIFDLYNNNEISIEEYISNINPLSPLCYARQNGILVVDVDGTLRKCTEYLDNNKINNIGNISEGKFNIDEQLHSQWLMPNNKLIQKRGCYDCVDMPVCFGGVCPMQWFRDKDISCNMFHSLTDKMLEIYFAEKDRMNKEKIN